MSHEQESIALMLVAEGKGILAADETVPTLTRRFDTLGIHSTEQSRRTYREMLFTAPGVAEFVSGVILQDKTIRQNSSAGTPLAQVLSDQGILPGIKVDTGAKPLAGSPDERVTEGLDGLRDRLREYRAMGPASRSGGRHPCYGGSAEPPLRQLDMPRSARNSTSCRSSSRKC